MPFFSAQRFFRRCRRAPKEDPNRPAVVLQPLEQIQSAIQGRPIGHPVQLVAGYPAPTTTYHRPRVLPPPISSSVIAAPANSTRHQPTRRWRESPPPLNPHNAKSIEFEGRIYWFNDVLGKGAFGTVKKAYTDGRAVAIKIINRERFLIDDVPVAVGINTAAGFISDISKERKALVLANSTGSNFLPQIEAFFQDYRFFYTVMPLYPISLADRLEDLGHDEMTMPLAEFKLKAAELTLALEALHLNGCFHCDIKPDNIMISQTGHIVLVDFGIAEVCSGILDGGPRGTPGYIAPEIRDGRAYYSAHAADIFSLGVVFLQMFLCPYSTGDIFTERGKIVMDSSSSHHNDKSARALIRAMTETNPDKRIPIGQVKVHPFFVPALDWYLVGQLSYAPTYVPPTERVKLPTPVTPLPSPAKPQMHLAGLPSRAQKENEGHNISNALNRRTPQTAGKLPLKELLQQRREVKPKTPVKERQPTPGRKRVATGQGPVGHGTKRTKVHVPSPQKHRMMIPIPNAEGKI